MAGIYIHIPYCKHKCNYCNFYSSPAQFNAKDYVNLLLREAKLRVNFFEGQALSTLYLGGGTPSLLDNAEIKRLIAGLMQLFPFEENPEISIEVNPDDIEKTRLEELKDTQINRISIGVQSFNNDALRYLERIHSGEQSYQALLWLKDAGFHNISADLIYGIPGVSIDSLVTDCKRLLELNIPHISAYNLTVEPSTRLEMQIKKKQRESVVSEEGAEAFILLSSMLEESGFLHYEISNFAKPAYFSRHNTSYWQGEKYLGLGPSAHSFNGESREWNVSSIKKYTDSLHSGILQKESELLSQTDHYNEYVMTSLRTMWGSDLAIIEAKYGQHYRTYCMQQAQKWVDSEHILLKGDILRLHRKGKLFADGIASSMFYI